MTPVRSLKTGLISGSMLVGNAAYAPPFNVTII